MIKIGVNVPRGLPVTSIQAQRGHCVFDIPSDHNWNHVCKVNTVADIPAPPLLVPGQRFHTLSNSMFNIYRMLAVARALPHVCSTKR